MTSRDQPRALSGAIQSPPKLGGDELFVPASHVLITDRQVSHPAFRLWCVLHRLWFLHEPPVMELLQELMGTTITDKATRAETWQPATRRSIERWLTELEHRRLAGLDRDAARRLGATTCALAHAAPTIPQ
jgi:hypothetical protein